MRKIFFLIPVLMFALMAKATQVPVSPGTQTLYAAYNDAAAGSTLVLAAGTYNETERIQFTKSMTIMAVEGAEVIVKTYKDNPLTLGAEVKFIGIQFDGSAMGTREYFIRSYDATAGNELHFENCEVYNFPSTTYLINAASNERSLDSIIINNCYFHNNGNDAIYVSGAAASKGIIITNSTFANSSASHSIIEVRNGSSDPTEDIELTVDHCTFYNNTFGDGDYSNIRAAKLAKSYISNCIFAHSEAYAKYAAYSYGGTISNCLTYNLTSGYRNWSPCAVFSNNITANPLFNDLANNKYTVAGNWVTMNISPARGAATDGSDLGDPKWYSAEVLPSTDFVAPYAFLGEKAVVGGSMEHDTNNYIHSKSAGGSAIWKIHATRSCNVQVTLNMDPDGQVIGHNYQVEVFDADGNSIGSLDEGGWKNNVDDKVLSGNISFPAEGDYKIELTNSISGTASTIKGITLAYAGGAVVTVPAEELLGTEAVLVNAGSLKVSKQDNGDLKYGDNGSPLTEYVYWNINATKRGDMKVTLNVVAPTVGDASTHNFLVELYSDLNEASIATSAEAAATSGTGAKVLPDVINIPAVGNYIVKLTNQTQWSSAILHSIKFEYLGGETITVPANALIGEEAVLVDEGHLKVSKLANGDLKYGDNGNQLDEYVYWNINATKYGRMNVTANVVAPGEGDPSGHQFLIELYSDLSESPIASSAEAASTSATGAVAMPALNFPAVGNYIVKLTNQKQWSSAILSNIELAYAGGEVADVPGQIVAADAMLLKEDGGTLKMYLDENGDIKYNDNGYNLTEYAMWNINATEAGEMIVTFNVTNSGHLFTVELYNGNTLVSSVEEPDATKWDDGDIELTDHLNIPAAGSYTIKLINRQQYSGGAIHGITFTKYVAPTAVTMNDEATDISAWSAYVGGAACNVQLNRTILGGMYNAICLPFALTGSQVKAAFGNDVELYYLDDASLDGEVLNLQFAVANDIYQGTPYLIKTSSNVVNPTFNGVSIVLDEASSTYHDGWPVSFKGSFVAQQISAGTNNLLLYADNKVGFPSTDKTLKGFRAYFHLSNPSLAPAIRRAQIVAGSQVVTDINLVNGELMNATLKTIENGQLIIIKNGVRYNVQGQVIR